MKGFADPQKMDLMAQLAGMPLETCCADWQRASFTADSKAFFSFSETIARVIPR